MEARQIAIDSPETFRAAVREAAEALRAGEIVAVPTETVYGLAANALSEAAVRKIYEAKGRPAENPVIVHVASFGMARECASEWPHAASALAKKFWPGPLTLVLPKAGIVPAVVAAGGRTVGLRWPAHPFMQALIQECNFPLAAPSANLANQISPTTAAHVMAGMRGRVPLVVDAGPANVGIESTVLDLSVSPPRLLRPGMVRREELEAVLSVAILETSEGEGHLKSPGLMKRHYSPKARLVTGEWRDDRELRLLAESFGVPLGSVHVLAHERIPRAEIFGRVCVIPEDAEAYARALYDELHRCDEAGASLIIVEKLPPGSAWSGLRDRLKRASTNAPAP